MGVRSPVVDFGTGLIACLVDGFSPCVAASRRRPRRRYAGLYWAILSLNNVSRSFGKNAGYTVGLLFLPLGLCSSVLLPKATGTRDRGAARGCTGCDGPLSVAATAFGGLRHSPF